MTGFVDALSLHALHAADRGAVSYDGLTLLAGGEPLPWGSPLFDALARLVDDGLLVRAGGLLVLTVDGRAEL